MSTKQADCDAWQPCHGNYACCVHAATTPGTMEYARSARQLEAEIAELRRERNPATPSNRFNDLNRQGFMRNVYAKPRKPKSPPPIVACDNCLNWHAKGKHTATAAQRKVNRAARRR